MTNKFIYCLCIMSQHCRQVLSFVNKLCLSTKVTANDVPCWFENKILDDIHISLTDGWVLYFKFAKAVRQKPTAGFNFYVRTSLGQRIALIVKYSTQQPCLLSHLGLHTVTLEPFSQWILTTLALPLVLWYCWLDIEKSIWPVENWIMRCWRGSMSIWS